MGGLFLDWHRRQGEESGPRQRVIVWIQVLSMERSRENGPLKVCVCVCISRWLFTVSVRRNTDCFNPNEEPETEAGGGARGPGDTCCSLANGHHAVIEAVRDIVKLRIEVVDTRVGLSGAEPVSTKECSSLMYVTDNLQANYRGIKVKPFESL